MRTPSILEIFYSLYEIILWITQKLNHNVNHHDNSNATNKQWELIFNNICINATNFSK
jgi:hypothetical protein